MLLATIMFLEAPGREVFPGSGVVSERATDAALAGRGSDGEPGRGYTHDGEDERLVAFAHLDDDALHPNELATSWIVSAQACERKGEGAGVENAQLETSLGSSNDVDDAARSSHRSATSPAARSEKLTQPDQRRDEADEDAGPDAPRRQAKGSNFDRPRGRDDGRSRWAWIQPAGWGTASGLFGMGMIGVRRGDGTVARRASLVCIILALCLVNALLLQA